MKKTVIMFLFIIVFAQASMAEKAYLDVYVKGKDTGCRIIADISLPNMNSYGKDHLVWQQIYICPFYDKKYMGLSSQVYSLENGSVTNLNLSENKITFRLDLSYYSLPVVTGARYMDIVITKKMNSSAIEDISGFSQWTDLKTNQIFNVQWKRSLKPGFKFPYTLVY